MRRLFIYLLKKYSKTEKERLEIFKVLDSGIYYEYNEQTPFGNVYNMFIEFVISNKFILTRVRMEDNDSIKITKRGLMKSFDESIEIIEKEKLYNNI